MRRSRTLSLVAAVVALGVSTAPATAAPGGRVIGTVRVLEADGKPAADADVIVYVVGFAEPARPDTITRIQQRGRAFVPALVAVTVGEQVAFPNADTFLHNVFSNSGARRFDLGSFKKGETKAREFIAPGVVDVYCNIHPEMAATILVLPNRKHVRARSGQPYVLADVPPGTWTVFAYTRRAIKPTSAKVTVTAGADATVDLAVQRGAETPHLNKFGERYRPEPPTTYR